MKRMSHNVKAWCEFQLGRCGICDGGDLPGDVGPCGGFGRAPLKYGAAPVGDPNTHFFIYIIHVKIGQKVA